MCCCGNCDEGTCCTDKLSDGTWTVAHPSQENKEFRPEGSGVVVDWISANLSNFFALDMEIWWRMKYELANTTGMINSD